MSSEELESMIPVRPPRVKRKMKPLVQSIDTEELLEEAPYKDANQLKILTPVGTAIVIVAAVK